MIRPRRVCALLVVIVIAPVVASCSQLPFHDESYRTRIPAAIEGANLGISNSWSGVSLDGFSETLNVGGNIDLAAQPGQRISPEFLSELLDVVLSNDPPPSKYIEISLRDAEDESIDLDDALRDLTASARSDGSISVDEARRISSEDTH